MEIDWKKPLQIKLTKPCGHFQVFFDDMMDWQDVKVTEEGETVLYIGVCGKQMAIPKQQQVFINHFGGTKVELEVRNKPEIIPNHPLIEMPVRAKEDFYPDPACMPRELTPEEIDKLNGFDMDKLNEYLTLREGHEPIRELYEAIMVDIWTACGKELFNDYHEWQKATRILNEIADKIKERLGVE